MFNSALPSIASYLSLLKTLHDCVRKFYDKILQYGAWAMSTLPRSDKDTPRRSKPSKFIVAGSLVHGFEAEDDDSCSEPDLKCGNATK